jgi:ribosomal protein L44E
MTTITTEIPKVRTTRDKENKARKLTEGSIRNTRHIEGTTRPTGEMWALTAVTTNNTTVSYKCNNVSEKHTTLKIVAACSSEVFVNVYQTSVF